MAKQRKAKKTRKKYPERAKDVPVTQAMLFEVRDALSARMDQKSEQATQQFQELKQEIHGVKNGLQQEIHGVKNGLQQEICGVKNELQQEICGVKNELQQEICGVKAELKQELHEVKQVIHEIRGMFYGMDQKYHELKVLVEEQNARNRIVLDGLTNLFARQDRIEKKLG